MTEESWSAFCEVKNEPSFGSSLLNRFVPTYCDVSHKFLSLFNEATPRAFLSRISAIRNLRLLKRLRSLSGASDPYRRVGFQA